MKNLTLSTLASLLVAAVFITAPSAFAVSNSGITYQGRIMKPDDTPVTGVHTQFRMQIRSPGTDNCVMYEELQEQDLSDSSGSFSLTLNDGNGVRQDTATYDIDQIFANKGTFTFAGASCPTADVTYAPGADDHRVLVVEFKDETMASWEPMPPQTINYVPMALQAKNIAGFGIGNLVRVQEADGILTNVTPLSNANYDALKLLVAGTSALYEKPGKLGGITVPSMGATPGKVLGWDGSAWTVADPIAGVQAFAKTALPACASGAYLRNNAGALECTTPAVGTTGTVTEIRTGTGLTGGPINDDGDIALATLNAGGTGFKVTYDVYGRVTAAVALVEADIPQLSTAGKVVGSAITSGTIGGSTAIDTTGLIKSTSGSFTALGTQNLQVYKTNNAYSVSIIANPALNSNYTLTLPVDGGANGQVLGTSGSGQLVWTTPAAPGTGDFKADGSVPMTGNLRLNGNYVSGDGGSEGVFVDADGKVGIGMASPTALLEVAGAIVGSSTLRVGSSGTNGMVYLNHSGGTLGGTFSTNGSGEVRLTTAAGHLTFLPANSEAMRITAAGNVGIGTTLPGTKLDVNGTIKVADSGETCAAGINGAIRFNGGNLQFCVGTAWTTLGAAGAGLTALTGDVTASGGGSQAATIAANAVTTGKILDGTIATVDLADDNVTFAKIQNVPTATIAGRYTAGSGDLESLTLGTGLALSGAGVLSSTVTDSFASTLGACANGTVPLRAGGVWTCGVPTPLSTNSALVQRDATGNFAANVITANGFAINNAGSAVTLANLAGSAYTLTMPVGLGTNGQVLSTSGSGQLTWTTPSGGGSGDFKADGTVAMTGAFRNVAGTSSLPSYTFAADTNTGLFSSFADEIGITAGGSQVMYANPSGVGFFGGSTEISSIGLITTGYVGAATGSALVPSFAVAGAGGMYSPTSNTIALSTAGAERMRVGATGNVGIGATPLTGERLNVTGGAMVAGPQGTGVNSAGELRLKELAAGGTNYVGFRSPDGLTADYVWTLPTSLGTNGQVLTTNASGVLSWTTPSGGGGGDFKADGTVAMTAPIRASNGTQALPSISFAGDTNSGFASLGTADEVSLVAGGTAKGYFNTGTFSWDGDMNAQRFTSYGGGTQSMPDYLMNGSGSNAGMFAPATNVVAFSTASTERMRIGATGNVGIGTTPLTGERLNVTGGAIVAGPQGTGVNSAGELRLKELAAGGTNYVGFRSPDGLTADYVWTLPTSLGTNGQVLTTNASGVLSWSTPAAGGGLPAANGTAAAPSISFTSDSDTGFYRDSDNYMGIAAGGSVVGYLTSSGLSMSGTKNVETSSGNIMASNGYVAGQFINAYGTGVETAPQHSFQADTNTGMFNPGADILAFTTAGAERMRIGATGNVGIGTTAAPNGKLDVKGSVVMSGATSGYSGFQVPTAAGSTIYTLPAVAPTNGYVLSSDAAGVLSWIAQSGGGAATSVLAGDGTVAAPSISFSADTNTGFYRTTADTISIGVNGTAVGVFDQFGLTMASASKSVTTPADMIAGVFRKYGAGTSTNAIFTLDSTTNTGLTYPAANVIGFRNTSGEAMRLDASGNLGIGITPTAKLHVSGNALITGRTVAGVSTNANTFTSVTADFSASNTIRSTAAAAACGTLNVTNTAAGGSFTITLKNATTLCTTVQWNGATTNVKLPSGYTGGMTVAGAVYSFLDDGATLWVSVVPF